MGKLKFVNSLPENEVRKLIENIDTVLFDIDGVLLHNKMVIPGADKVVEKLRKCGKNIVFLTNNSIYPIHILLENLKLFGAVEKEIVTPNISLLIHLEKIGFNRDIYVIGCSLVKSLLKKAGYNVIEYKDIQPADLEESIIGIKQLAQKTMEICKNVGIVYLDLDFNCHHGNLQVSKFILNHIRDVQLLTGLIDDQVPIGGNMNLIGPKFYLDGLERWTKRKAITMGKPGSAMAEAINSTFDIADRSRVLMVGDNALTDIAFGVNLGLKTCLVLSGLWQIDQVENWKHPEELKPDIVANSLEDIYMKIKNM